MPCPVVMRHDPGFVPMLVPIGRMILQTGQLQSNNGSSQGNVLHRKCREALAHFQQAVLMLLMERMEEQVSLLILLAFPEGPEAFRFVPAPGGGRSSLRPQPQFHCLLGEDLRESVQFQ